MTKLIIIFAALSVLFPGTGHAYIDPGTGSYVLQIVIGVILGAAIAVRAFWARIRAFLSGLISKNRRGK